MGNIEWIEIDFLPSELRDGRWLLLWGEDGWSKGKWDRSLDWPSWVSDANIVLAPTHFAEIAPPSATRFVEPEYLGEAS